MFCLCFGFSPVPMVLFSVSSYRFCFSISPTHCFDSFPSHLISRYCFDLFPFSSSLWVLLLESYPFFNTLRFSPFGLAFFFLCVSLCTHSFFCFSLSIRFRSSEVSLSLHIMIRLFVIHFCLSDLLTNLAHLWLNQHLANFFTSP